MGKSGFHLHPHHSLSTPTSLLLLHTQKSISHFHNTFNPCFLLLRRRGRRSCCCLHLSSRRLHIPRSRRWDSNADNFNFDADDEGDDFDDNMEQWAESLEDYIDSIWIFKVFGSYGWMLPLILLSLLLANGPKAFLMAMALPIGQSTFAFAIQRFQNRDKFKPKVKNKNNNTKKARSRAYSSRNRKLDEAAEWLGNERPRKKKKAFQSWVYKNDVSVNSSDKSTATKFGGWDELDAGMESNEGSSRRAATKTSGIRGMRSKKGKNERLSKSDEPLFLRLLISIFPFLSSWIEVL